MTAIRDSMNESQIRSLLSYAIQPIRCGHTAVLPSKNWEKQITTRSTFPLQLKWINSDTVFITNMLKGLDSLIRPGDQLLSMNGQSMRYWTDSLLRFLPVDGYSITNAWQTLSNNAGFYAKRYLGFAEDSLSFVYLDSAGQTHSLIWQREIDKKKDSARPKSNITRKSPDSFSAKSWQRNYQYDSLSRIGLLTVNTFNNGFGLSRFFRRTFRKIKQNPPEALIVDIRRNGGGNLRHSTLLTKLLSSRSFVLADSVVAPRRVPVMHKGLNQDWARLFFYPFMTKRKADQLEVGYFQRHVYRPHRLRFTHKVAVLTGGSTFSAASLMAGQLKGQDHIVIIGEETGGGNYGNSGILIPDLRLPETGIRVRLPLFKIVADAKRPNNGRGVMPDIVVVPSADDIRLGKDPKLRVAVQWGLAKPTNATLYTPTKR
jgi:hypothetical protein